MFIKKFLTQIDGLICHYLGLDRDITKINRLHYAGKQLMVTQTSGFKRHVMKSSWHDFANLEAANLEQFGQQTGKAIANHLVISFKVPIVRINHHA
jgi:hypothetical protein